MIQKRNTLIPTVARPPSPFTPPDPVPDVEPRPTPPVCGEAPAPADGAGPTAPREAATDPGDETATRPRQRLSTLPLGARIGLFLVGWILVAIGLAGLLLPGIQGIATLLIGAAVLSLVSEAAYSLVRWLLRRWPLSKWPRIGRDLEAFRLKMHRRLERRRKP